MPAPRISTAHPALGAAATITILPMTALTQPMSSTRRSSLTCAWPFRWARLRNFASTHCLERLRRQPAEILATSPALAPIVNGFPHGQTPYDGNTDTFV